MGKIERKSRRCRCGIAMAALCLAVFALCGCAGKAEEQVKPEKSVSEAMTYEELVQYCTETQAVSAFEMEARLRRMQITGPDEAAGETAFYRVLSVPSKSDDGVCLTTFVAESEEREDDWEIKSIKSAWVKSAEDEELSYLGGVTYWIRDKKSIEYVVNGDFCSVDDVTVETQEAKGGKTGFTSYKADNDDAPLQSRKYAHIHKTEGFGTPSGETGEEE